ncbi:two component transcriptional regulator, LuxR family [Chitinophaga sp. CF118]|uniref:response regulator n=1 Tax=Chitinophaga sp. CF118 TaxID=1884367 RepID=UPI0008EDBEA0|nr:response regulator transcription factor [Chitinophaga sp. CF118]SFD74535.1 two component transcriptional regulator, LuxR family [Chitinophaga sp. CF118]
MINILVADDHSIVRYGLRKIVSALSTPSIVSTVETFDDVITIIGEKTFDLLILDINLPGGNSIQMLDAVRFRQPNIMILIFSAYDEKMYAIDYLLAGADGYLSKNSTEEETKLAISTLLNREKYMSASTRQLMLSKFSQNKNPQTNPFETLSVREVEVMNLLTKGIPLLKIAEMLHLQISTVSTYKTRIFAKLEVTTIIELLEKIRLHNISI